MLNGISPTWVLGAWFAMVPALVAWTVSVDAELSTSLVVLVLGIAPAGVMLLMRASEPTPTVAEILHSVHATDRRS